MATTTTINFLLRPLCISTILSKYPIRKTHLSSLILTPILSFRSVSSSSLTSPPTPVKTFTPTFALPQQQELEEEEEEEDEELDIVSEIQDFDVGSEISEEEEDEEKETENPVKEEIKRTVANSGEVVELPVLTIKEKKELASYAHGLGKKLKSQLVGKGGVTDNVVNSFIETLEANELLKIKFHGTCPGELDDMVKHLEKATGSVVVSKIGRTVIIYRPSISKLKLEEKKRQARKVFVRKELKFKPVLPNKVQEPHHSGRGRRGSSRV